MQENKSDVAKKRFEDILKKDKKHIQAMNALAGIALSQGKNDEATAWLERARNENPGEIQPALQLGAHYLRIGENKKALDLAKRLQGIHSDNLPVIELLAQAQLANLLPGYPIHQPHIFVLLHSMKQCKTHEPPRMHLKELWL